MIAEVEKAKKIAELTKKIESAKSEVKRYSGFLESDIRFDRDTTQSRIDLKYASRRLESLQKERDRLM